MNKLLNLYGVKIHSERAFLSFLENSRNEVEAFSSSYIERKVGNLVFSIPADTASTGLNQVIPFLQSSESWHGLVSRPSAEAPQDSVFIIRFSLVDRSFSKHQSKVKPPPLVIIMGVYSTRRTFPSLKKSAAHPV